MKEDARVAQPARVAYLSHGSVLAIVLIIVFIHVEEKHPLTPRRGPNAQFAYPLPRQLANMVTPIIQYGGPHCEHACAASTLIRDLVRDSVLV